MNDLQTISKLQLIIKNALANGSFRRGIKYSDSIAIISAYEQLAAKIYRLRNELPANDSRRTDAEDFFASITQDLLALQRANKIDNRQTWLEKYRQIWREEISVFVFCLVLFISSTLVGWTFAVHRPEYVPVLMPQQLIESILDKNAWFSELQKNPLLGGIQIATNNIRVCILAFSLGALLGLGGLYILCFNGLFLGAILGYCWVNGFYDAIEGFILGHGPLELSVIIASSFASLLYGRAFFTLPYSKFQQHFLFGAMRAFTVIIGVVPWLLLAACVESFVSPFHYLSYPLKMSLGIILAACFWSWTLLGSAKSKS